MNKEGCRGILTATTSRKTDEQEQEQEQENVVIGKE
jgi:hypothetical protein